MQMNTLDGRYSMYCLFMLPCLWFKGRHCTVFIPFYPLTLGIHHLSEIVENISCCSALYLAQVESPAWIVRRRARWVQRWGQDERGGHVRVPGPINDVPPRNPMLGGFQDLPETAQQPHWQWVTFMESLLPTRPSCTSHSTLQGITVHLPWGADQKAEDSPRPHDLTGQSWGPSHISSPAGCFFLPRIESEKWIGEYACPAVPRKWVSCQSPSTMQELLFMDQIESRTTTDIFYNFWQVVDTQS